MRHTSSGTFELASSAATAFEMFTPEGERAWAPGWNPVYAAEPTESPGTVFTTDAHGVDTIWLILGLDRVGHKAAYARVTPGHHAGTVRVVCADTDPEGCVVTVTYDMALLPGADPDDLVAYSDVAFAAMMEHWARLVGAALVDRTT